jgi:hypothetical protein
LIWWRSEDSTVSLLLRLLCFTSLWHILLIKSAHGTSLSVAPIAATKITPDMTTQAKAKSAGLSYKWLDLHVHTPSSHDFADRALDPEGRRKQIEEIIRKARTVGLHAIAITDHNVVTAIDEAKEIARPHGLTIFPGFEISCGGSLDGPIHVLGVFDPACTQAELERVLGRLEIGGEGADALTAKSVNDVIDIIRGLDGLPILAHANSSHGALNDIRGNPRTAIVQNSSLIAVEATAADFAKPQGKRLLDILDGSDSKYRRKLAVFSGSDNPASGTGHSAEGVGRRFSAFKMGELTVESLRQCFEDRDTRILQFEELGKTAEPQPRIIEVRIEGGFLGGQSLQFHAGMTSVIGATGTGKSLLIEFLRFAFQKPPHAGLMSEHKAKLLKQLKEGGTVCVRFADMSNDEYEISRTFNAKSGQDARCVNCSTGAQFDGEITSIFPILFYSQNEILEVTRDPRAQLNLLDSFRNSESRNQKLAALTGELRDLDRQLATALGASGDLSTLRRQVKTLDEQLKKCAKKLKVTASKEYVAFSELEDQKSSAEGRLPYFDSMQEVVTDAADALTQSVSDLPEAGAQSPEADVVSQIFKVQNHASEQLSKTFSLIEDARKKSERIIRSWEKKAKFTKAQKAYRRSLQRQSKLATVESERKTLQGERDKIGQRVQRSQTASQRLQQVRESRRVRLRSIEEERIADFRERDV